MAYIIDGKAISNDIIAEVKVRADALSAKGITPCLAVIMAGDNPASEIYVRNKRRACKRAGIESRYVKFDADVTEKEILDAIDGLNKDDGVHAILVQLPLPKQIDELKVLDAILPEKDADGFHVVNAGRLLTGRDCTLPCTPAGCMELLCRSGRGGGPFQYSGQTHGAFASAGKLHCHHVPFPHKESGGACEARRHSGVRRRTKGPYHRGYAQGRRGGNRRGNQPHR